MERLRITKDRFVFVDVTDVAKELWNAGTFELFEFENDTESKIETEDDLIRAIENGSVCIEGGQLGQRGVQTETDIDYSDFFTENQLSQIKEMADDIAESHIVAIYGENKAFKRVGEGDYVIANEEIQDEYNNWFTDTEESLLAFLMHNLVQPVQVFTTDLHHSHSSRELVGTFSCIQDAIDAVYNWCDNNISCDEALDKCNETKESLLEGVHQDISTIYQTQCLPDFEFMIEKVEIDNIIKI